MAFTLTPFASQSGIEFFDYAYFGGSLFAMGPFGQLYKLTAGVWSTVTGALATATAGAYLQVMGGSLYGMIGFTGGAPQVGVYVWNNVNAWVTCSFPTNFGTRAPSFVAQNAGLLYFSLRNNTNAITPALNGIVSFDGVATWTDVITPAGNPVYFSPTFFGGNLYVMDQLGVLYLVTGGASVAKSGALSATVMDSTARQFQTLCVFNGELYGIHYSANTIGRYLLSKWDGVSAWIGLIPSQANANTANPFHVFAFAGSLFISLSSRLYQYDGATGFTVVATPFGTLEANRVANGVQYLGSLGGGFTMYTLNAPAAKIFMPAFVGGV